MSVEQLLAEVRSRLRAGADPAVASTLRRFFREPVDPYGVRQAQLTPIVQMASREMKQWPLAARNRFCTELIKSGKLEEGALVAHIYRRFRKQCAVCEFRLFERWIDRYVSNWGACDGVSSWLIAACIENEPGLAQELPAWTRSTNRWKRRASAVALLQEAKQGRNTEMIFRIAELLREDEDDMVRKGVGWLLKETYPKKPREVVRFLRTWKDRAPRLTLRYAAEKMSDRDRAAVL